jgi:hypothetical protein
MTLNVSRLPTLIQQRTCSVNKQLDITTSSPHPCRAYLPTKFKQIHHLVCHTAQLVVRSVTR